MQKKFVANLFFLLVLNLVIKPFWILGIDRSAQNILGTEDYGQYFALMNFTFLLNILLDVGLTNYNNRNISRYQFLVAKYFSSLFTLKLILGVVYLIVAGLFAMLMGYTKISWLLVSLLLFNQFFVYLVLYLRSNLAALQLFKQDSIISVLDRFLMIFLCGVLIWGHKANGWLTIETFVIAQTIAYFITAVVAGWLVFRQVKHFRFKFKFSVSRIILKKSLPYAILVLLMTFYNRTDSVMLAKLLPGSEGAIQSGIYAHGYRLLDAVNMIAFLFSTLLLPMFSTMLKRGEAVQGLVETAFKILMSGVILISVVCFVFSEHIITLLYTDEIAESAIVFRWLILNLIPISVTYIFGTLLTANGNLKWLNRMAILGVSINIILNILLIPVYKAFGTAISSLITQSFTAIIQVFMALKFVEFTLNKALFVKVAAYAILIFVFAKCLLMLDWDTIIWIKMIVVLGFGLVCALLFDLLSVKSALALFKNKGE